MAMDKPKTFYLPSLLGKTFFNFYYCNQAGDLLAKIERLQFYRWGRIGAQCKKYSLRRIPGLD